MKLTEKQVLIRGMFRKKIIAKWSSPTNIQMWGVVKELAVETSSTEADVYEELSKIPSIGALRPLDTIHLWMVRYYKPIANALWDGKDEKHVMAMFGKLKKTYLPKSKFSAADRKERSGNRKVMRRLKAASELVKHSGDRWERTAWGKVK